MLSRTILPPPSVLNADAVIFFQNVGTTYQTNGHNPDDNKYESALL
jgi:hypothetical protein